MHLRCRRRRPHDLKALHDLRRDLAEQEVERARGPEEPGEALSGAGRDRAVGIAHEGRDVAVDEGVGDLDRRVDQLAHRRREVAGLQCEPDGVHDLDGLEDRRDGRAEHCPSEVADDPARQQARPIPGASLGVDGLIHPGRAEDARERLEADGIQEVTGHAQGVEQRATQVRQARGQEPEVDFGVGLEELALGEESRRELQDAGEGCDRFLDLRGEAGIRGGQPVAVPGQRGERAQDALRIGYGTEDSGELGLHRRTAQRLRKRGGGRRGVGAQRVQARERLGERGLEGGQRIRERRELVGRRLGVFDGRRRRQHRSDRDRAGARHCDTGHQEAGLAAVGVSATRFAVGY